MSSINLTVINVLSKIQSTVINKVNSNHLNFKVTQSAEPLLFNKPTSISVPHHPKAPWVNRWLEKEKFSNGFRARENNALATVCAVDSKYRPGSDNVSFDLPAFQIPKPLCRVFKGEDLNSSIMNEYIKADHCKFLIHPQIRTIETIHNIPQITSHYETALKVSSTASFRTLFMFNSDLPPHCIKTHFPLQITRSIRRLREHTIIASLAISKGIASSQTLKNNPWFGYMPETMGVVYGEGKDSWGYLVREITPRPFIAEDRSLIPLFSLYSPDSKNPDELPLLQKMIERSRLDPKIFILEKLFFPLLSCWVDAFEDTGIAIEAHGQNTCIEIDAQGVPKRFVFRDFDTMVNEDIRREKGLSLEGMPYHLYSDKEGIQGSELSMIFDQAMKVPLEAIANLAQKTYGIPKGELQKEFRSYLHEIFPRAYQYFPKDGQVFNFPPGVVTAQSKPAPTGESPVWR